MPVVNKKPENNETSNNGSTLDLPCPACGEAVFVLPFTDVLFGRLNCPNCQEEVVLSWDSNQKSFYCVTAKRRKELIEEAKEIVESKFLKWWREEYGDVDYSYLGSTCTSLKGNIAYFMADYEDDCGTQQTQDGFEVDVSLLP